MPMRTSMRAGPGILLLILLNWFPAILSGQTAANGLECVSYTESVRLTGTLHERTFRGPPSHETHGPTMETGFYLRLAKPVCTTGDKVTGWGAVLGARDIQLIMDSSSYATLRPHLGSQVELAGTLVPAHGEGHHHAPLLLDLVTRRINE